MSTEAAKKPRVVVRKVRGRKIPTGKVLPRGTLTIDEPQSAQEDDSTDYREYLIQELDRISTQISTSTDEKEKKRLLEQYMAKSMQLPDQAQPLSIAPPELTDADRELMGQITALHTRMRLAESPEEKDSIRQQIFEKQ